MRLLEFPRDASAANPLHTSPEPVQPINSPEQVKSEASQPRRHAHLPIEGNTLRKPARRSPIDLEHLQQRIEAVEKRLLLRARRQNVPEKDVEALRQRLKKLESNVGRELWAARQREQALLELLARPTPGQLVMQRLRRVRTHGLPASRRWLADAGREWWQDHQPGWWTGFARAWQESLDRARGLS